MTSCLTIETFGVLPDGSPAALHVLNNGQLRVRVTDFGARMVSIEAPDRTGDRAHVLLGLEDAAAYATSGGSFGAVLGRCANRIAGGCFTLHGRLHRLATNKDGTTLHGGPNGFGNRPWRTMPTTDGAQPEIALFLNSPDGDQGFPGAVTAQATYRLDGACLWLTLEASTDADTVLNLSAHPYFNFRDGGQTDILDHEVMIDADHFLPVNAHQIPTGEVRSVSGTPFDFRNPEKLNARIRQNDPQLVAGRGYDNCFVLNGGETAEPRLVASLRDPVSGRGVEILTTQPGLQLYSGNSLDGSVFGRDGLAFRQSSGIALEAQGFPDAVHHPNFPSVLLRKGEHYRQVIGYRFTVK